ncbi:hypothetical protein HXX76_013023 [Chlamydomonas incerta]|nr:hypothetical protein HXX76_013023 [Chlamydomonas incerta]|eukprot:KAG2426266.1 hypothetical protein HXX76_013023 [Chlamydomonas incerta]
MLARQLATAPPVMVIVDLDVGCFLSNGAELESRVEAAMASTSMDRVHELTSAERRRQEAAGSPTAAARRQRWAQVRLLLSHALHRWLPPLARFVQQLPGAELSRLVSMEQQWCSRPAGNKFTGFPGLHVAYDCVARALVWIRPPLTALAAAEAVAAARAHALSAARIADGDGSAGSGGSRSSSSSSGAVAAREAELAAATAELASWRQLLFAEVDVVAVIGAGIRMVLQLCSRALHTPLPGLAATTRGDADGGGGGIAGADVPAVCSLVTLLQDALRTACQAAPTEMAAVLLAAAADAAAGPEAAAASAAASPWNPRMLQQLAYADWARQPGMFSSEDVAGGMEAANRHNVEGLREFARAHGVAAARAGFDGGPAARYCRIAGEAVPGLDRWTPVSPLAVRQGAPAAARPAVAAAGSGSSHPSGAAAASPGWGPAAELLPPLRCCANPRCTNLAAAVGADSDADLPLHSCSGCRGAAEYCSKGCQTAHWRAGHREACAALRDR